MESDGFALRVIRRLSDDSQRMLGRLLLLALSVAMLGAGIAEVHFATNCTGSCGDSVGLGVVLIVASTGPLVTSVMRRGSPARPPLATVSIVVGAAFILLVIIVVVGLSQWQD
jgi:hypothetical protein